MRGASPHTTRVWGTLRYSKNMEDTKKVPLVGTIWNVAFNTLKNNPVILLVFALSGILKLICLLVIFLSIFYPLSIVFGPIIKTLWGGMFLHYPFNFSLMPKLFYYSQITVYIFIDSLLSGTAIWMAFQANEGKKPKLLEALKKVLSKYVTLAGFLLAIFLVVWLVYYGEKLLIFKLAKLKFMASLIKTGMLDFALVFVNFFIIILVEMIFSFAMPFAVLEDKRFFKAVWASLTLAKKLFLSTFILIFIPTLVTLPFSLLKTGLSALMDKTIPEITLLVLGLSVIVTVFIDCIVTVSLTLLFLLKKDLQIEKAK